MTEDDAEQPAAQPEQQLWLPVATAARLLNVSQQAIRGRIERGTLETKREIRGNKVRTLVEVDPSVDPSIEHDDGPPGQDLEERLLNSLRGHVEQAVQRHLMDLVEQREADLRARLAEKDARIADLRGELERRRWKGLIPWVRRLLHGE